MALETDHHSITEPNRLLKLKCCHAAQKHRHNNLVIKAAREIKTQQTLNPCNWCWWRASEFVSVTHSAATGTRRPLNNQWTNEHFPQYWTALEQPIYVARKHLKACVSWCDCPLSWQCYSLKDSKRRCKSNDTNSATHMNLSSDSRRTRTSRSRWIRAISTSISSGEMVLSAMDTSEWPEGQRDGRTNHEAFHWHASVTDAVEIMWIVGFKNILKTEANVFRSGTLTSPSTGETATIAALTPAANNRLHSVTTTTTHSMSLP